MSEEFCNKVIEKINNALKGAKFKDDSGREYEFVEIYPQRDIKGGYTGQWWMQVLVGDKKEQGFFPFEPKWLKTFEGIYTALPSQTI